MNNNALFFRKTFLQAIFLVLIPFLILKGVDYLYVLSNNNKYFDLEVSKYIALGVIYA